LEFSASAVDEMPDTLVSALIVHELAHALLYAEDEDARRPDDDAGRQRREDLVDQLTRTWGFGPDSVREWAAALGTVLD
jgi:predicted SprT family Zn-dependent metalloprotease